MQVSAKGGKMTTEQADRQYLARKKLAEVANVNDFVDYLMKHDGNPSQEFVADLRSSPQEYQRYVTNLEELLCDIGYADDFFGVTGKVLKVSANHTKSWAEKIAQSILAQTPTLQ